MLEVKNTEVFNFDGALRGMRNPLNSWAKSDSKWVDDHYKIGPADMKLCQLLLSAGNSDAKFLRQIDVCMDVTAPLYWWKEFDTYKVATVANSTSTMHRIQSGVISDECFSFDEDLYDLELFNNAEEGYDDIGWAFKDIITICEILRKKYVETKDKRYWRALIQILPEGWNQTRTITLNYAVLRNIYFQRRNHKLTEWHTFCDWIKSLPYAKELIIYEKEGEQK